MRQFYAVIRFVEANRIGCKMAGLAVHSQMGRMCGGFSVEVMALETHRTGFSAVWGAGNVRVTGDAGDMMMGSFFQRILCYGKGDFSAVDGAFAFRIDVALVAECLRYCNAFIGIDVGLPVAIQADQLPLVLVGILVRCEGSVDHGHNDNDTHGNSQSYPRFSDHQIYASSLFLFSL